MHPSIVSVNIGTPEQLGVEGAAAWYDGPWTTSIFKRALDRPVRVTATGLAGDGQADPVNHGGPDKAVCVYPADYYEAWRRVLALPADDFVFGAFGENLTVADVTEADVCIGDVWAAGDVLLQLSQPRQPCWKLARKWRIKDLTEQVLASGRTGWYFRVLAEGTVTRGTTLELRERPHPRWTVAAANGVLHHGIGDRDGLASLDELSASWKRKLAG